MCTDAHARHDGANQILVPANDKKIFSRDRVWDRTTQCHVATVIIDRSLSQGEAELEQVVGAKQEMGIIGII